MVRAGLIDSNKNANKWCCASETLAEFHRWKLHSELENIPPHFAWYGQNNSIHELREFGWYIYPITPSPKNVDYRTQEG